MIQITITTPLNRRTSGTLTVTDATGAPVFGPVPIAFAPRNCERIPNAESAEVAASVGSNFLAGSYIVRKLIAMSGASVEEVREFGRYGFVLLEQNPAEGEAAGCGECVCIHGGDLSESGNLRSASGALRLANRDQRELMKIIAYHGNQNILCQWIETAEDGPTKISDGSSSFAVAPYAKFSAVPAIGAVALPFVAQSSAYAQCYLYDSGAAFSSVDFDYIVTAEGGDQTTGYVPDNNSGVTIAGGLDLGFQTAAQMLAMGFSQAQVNTFTPYLATSASQPLIGQAARNALAQHPLTITQSQASVINNNAFSSSANSLASAYNNAVKASGKLPGVTFSSLPSPWQTAMADMYFAYPAFTSTTCFAQIASGEWSLAIKSLQAFPGPNSKINARAKFDGDYLSKKPLPTVT